ncbi:MAG: Lytic transglycosylase, catalytic [Candidatus Woesebacteria bacterium]|nr:MAG: Lytic transglycosylase, catalytic [Candidatus Woesebacteria bacterium]
MPTFWETLKTNILNPLEKGVSSVGQTLGDIFKPVGQTAIDLFKPIAALKPEQSEFGIKTEQGEYKPYTNIYLEAAAQTIGLGARKTDFWERLPHAYYGTVLGFGAGLAKAFTFGWWNPELKFEHDAAQMGANLGKVEGDIIGTIGTFLVGGEIVQGAARSIPVVARFAKIAPKTYSLLTNGLTFAGLGQLQKDEFYKDATQRATDFGADFALGGVFSIAGMKPSYFKSTGIIAPAAYVTSLIKGDTPEDALKNTVAVIGLHSVNYAVAKVFPSQAERIRRNMEKAAENELRTTQKEARAFLGVTEKSTPEQIKSAWKQKVIEITKKFPAQAYQTPQQAARFNQEWNTANRAYEFLAKVQNPTGYTGKTFSQEFEDLFRELWINVPDKRALVVSAVRNMPAGLSIRPTLTNEQRAEIIKGLGGENVRTKFGLPAGKLSNSDLITLAKEQNIKVTPSKGTPEQAIAEAAKTPPPSKPKVERTEIWNVPGDLMPARGKPTWKHSKMLWNTMRNQYGMTNVWGKDITTNKGAVSWIIDTLENGLASKKDLLTEARKTKGVRMDSHQYKKLYAMFKSRNYDIEGYKKVMATLKGIKPAVVEKTIEPTPKGMLEELGNYTKEAEVIVREPKIEPKTKIKPIEEVVTLYHGTTPENAAIIRKTGFELKPPVHGRQVIGEGVYLTPTKEEAATFGKEIIEATLKPGVKILHLNNPGEYYQLWQKVAKEAGAFGAKEVNMDKAISDWLKVRGYGGIEVKGFGTKGETYISIFDPKNIEVKTTKAPVAASAKKTKAEPKVLGKVTPQIEQLQKKKDALEKLHYANPGDQKIVNAIKKIDNQIAQQFSTQEQKAAKAEQIRLKYRPEEKELLDAERVPSVGEILKSKKFKDRIAGKVKASKEMRADELTTTPSRNPPRPPKEEPLSQAPPPPEGSGLEAIDKMVGKIGAPQKMTEWFKGLKPKFSRNFTDRFAAMKTFEENLSKAAGKPIDINSSPYVGMRLYAGRFGTIEAAFRNLQKIVTPVRKFRPDFTRYVLAQRAIERADRGFDNPAGVTKDQAEQALVELKPKVGDKVFKQFEQVGQAIQNWSIREILEPMRDTGLISKKAFNAIVEKNKNWMPFHVLDYLPDVHQADKMQSGSETFSVSKQGVIKGLKGTEKQIRDPFESIVDNLSKAVSLIKRNEVARKFIDLRNKYPEAKETIKYLHGDAKAPRDYDTISVFINGKSTRWAVPKDLSEAMHGMNPVEAGVLGKLALASTKAFKSGVTTLYIPFTLTNAIRDYQTATIVNKWGFNPANWLSGFKDGIKGAFKWESKAYTDFMKNQGGYGGYISNARQLSIASKELFTPTWWIKTKAVINPFNLISNFAEAVELAPRLGIYKKGVKKPGVTELEAAFEARNATVDFAKAGKEMRIINQWIPFVNARWQGLLRVKDAFKEHPFKSAIKAMALIVAPGVATYFYNILNHEELWDDIPQWAKDQYFIIILGSEINEEGKTVPKVLQIPKGDMGQIFYNPIEYAFEYVRKQEPANLLKLAVEWTSQLSPIPFSRDGELSGSAFLAGALPPALKTLVEEVTNMNMFTGFPIIPRKLEKVAPTEQYNEKTPELMVMLGRSLGWSPMRIAHVLSGLFGSSSRYVYNPTDLFGASVERFIRTQGGAKEREAWKVKDDAEIGYNTTRLFVQQALQAGDLQKAQSLATEWNAKAQQFIPLIVPYLYADDPKEAVSFQKSIMFDQSDLQRLLKLNAPQTKPGTAVKPPVGAVSAPKTQNDPLGLFGGASAATPTPQPTMGQIFPTGGGATNQNDPLGLFK